MPARSLPKQHPFSGLSPRDRDTMLREHAVTPIGAEANRRRSEQADRAAPTGLDSNNVAVVWDMDKTGISEYQQNQFFKILQDIQIAEGWSEDETFTVDQFWNLVHKEQDDLRGHPHRSHSDEMTCAGIMVSLSKSRGWNLSNDDILVMGKSLDLAEGFVKFNKRIKRIGAALGLNVEVYVASAGWRRFMLGATNQTVMVDGRPQQAIDDVYGIDFRSKDGPDTEPIRYSSAIFSASSKVETLTHISYGSHVWLERIGHRVNIDAQRTPLSRIAAVGDGVSDDLMLTHSGCPIGVWFKNDEPQRERMQSLADAGELSAATEANYAKGSPLEGKLVSFFIQCADEIRACRSDLSRPRSPFVGDMGTHPGTTRDRKLTPGASRKLWSPEYFGLGSERARHVDAVAAFRYLTQFGVVTAVDPKTATKLAGTKVPPKLTLLIPRDTERNDFAAQKMLARLHAKSGFWDHLMYKLPRRPGRSRIYDTVYGKIEIRRTSLKRSSFEKAVAEAEATIARFPIPVLPEGVHVKDHQGPAGMSPEPLGRVLTSASTSRTASTD